ncbi:MAG TPA: efflux RND transporter permease subunit, partial [Thermoanaerobaculia bacterium]
MSAHAGDDERIARTHNTARFFTETRQISWVLLLGTLLWGVFAYRAMPQRKDPEIPVRVALAICAWPGASAERIEQLVTRKMEEKIAENSKIKRITSNTRTGIAVVTIQLTDDAEDTARELDDIGGRLAALRGLPEGAGPINFVKDFGDTAALLLTIASPPIGRVEIDLRAAAVRSALAAVRAGLAPGAGPDRDQRVAIVYGFPRSISPDVIRPPFALFSRFAEEQGALRDVRPFSGSGFVGLDAVSPLTDAQLLALGQRFIHERLRASEIHPDAWQPVTIRDPRQIEERLAEVAGDKYSYRELQDVTDLVRRTLQTVPQVAKVTRSGLLEERIYLSYS